MAVFDPSQFDDGASYLVSQDTYEAFIEGKPFLGRPDKANGNLMIAKTKDIDDAISKSNGDIRELEALLGKAENSFGEGPVYKIDVLKPSEHNLRGATGYESSCNCFFATPIDENGKLPEVEFCRDDKGRIARDKNGWEIIDLDKTDEDQLKLLNGPYSTNRGELLSDEDGFLPNGGFHKPNLENYEFQTSGGTYEGFLDRVPNTPENVKYTVIDGWERGKPGNLTMREENGGYYRPDNALLMSQQENEPKEMESEMPPTSGSKNKNSNDKESMPTTALKENEELEDKPKKGNEENKGAEKQDSGMPPTSGSENKDNKESAPATKPAAPKSNDGIDR